MYARRACAGSFAVLGMFAQHACVHPPNPEVAGNHPKTLPAKGPDLTSVVQGDTERFRRSLADRRHLVGNDSAHDPQVVQKRLMEAIRLYATSNGAELRSQFEQSINRLPELHPPAGQVLQLRESFLIVDPVVTTAEEKRAQSAAAAVQLLLTPDAVALADRSIWSLLPSAMREKMSLSVGDMAACLAFFGVAKPVVGRGENDTLYFLYGETDTFVVRFARTHDDLPFASGLEWWTSAPVSLLHTDAPSSQ